MVRIGWIGLAAALAVTAAVGGGCSDTTSCKHLSETCSNFSTCCLSEGLLCQPGESGNFCAKTCRCHGTTICTPVTFSEGCPQGAACFANESDGKGECVMLCERLPCIPGEYRCGTMEDGGPISCSFVDAGPPDLLGID